MSACGCLVGGNCDACGRFGKGVSSNIRCSAHACGEVCGCYVGTVEWYFLVCARVVVLFRMDDVDEDWNREARGEGNVYVT